MKARWTCEWQELQGALAEAQRELKQRLAEKRLEIDSKERIAQLDPMKARWICKWRGQLYVVHSMTPEGNFLLWGPEEIFEVAAMERNPNGRGWVLGPHNLQVEEVLIR